MSYSTKAEPTVNTSSGLSLRSVIGSTRYSKNAIQALTAKSPSSDTPLALLSSLTSYVDSRMTAQVLEGKGTNYRRLTFRKSSSEVRQRLLTIFSVENFFCLGSPVGLFQMLKGRTIMARSVTAGAATSPMGEYPPNTFDSTSSSDLPFPVSSPKCNQLFNIFHPADPISYRLEPLVSKEMAQLKPQPLPYTKRGLFSSNGQIVGGISGIGQSVTRSVSSMWSTFSSGIASSILNRSLGITDTTLSSATSASDNNKTFIPTEGQHPPTMIDAEIETLYAGFQNRRKQADGKDQGEIERDERRIKREDNKVRALNSTGRIDFSIQEGVFDWSVIASIASHLSYWGDDVSYALLVVLKVPVLIKT